MIRNNIPSYLPWFSLIASRKQVESSRAMEIMSYFITKSERNLKAGNVFP